MGIDKSPAAVIGATLTAIHHTGDGADELPIHALARCERGIQLA
jgi:hypothetical protein